MNEEEFQRDFDEYFLDARNHGPVPGRVLARYSAVAEFINGEDKRDVVYLLKIGQTHAAVNFMKKKHGAMEPDVYRTCSEMSQDLLHMTEEDVLNKPYSFRLEFFFYAEKEHVPLTDPHWEVLSVLSYDKENNTFVSKIEI